MPSHTYMLGSAALTREMLGNGSGDRRHVQPDSGRRQDGCLHVLWGTLGIPKSEPYGTCLWLKRQTADLTRAASHTKGAGSRV